MKNNNIKTKSIGEQFSAISSQRQNVKKNNFLYYQRSIPTKHFFQASVSFTCRKSHHLQQDLNCDPSYDLKSEALNTWPHRHLSYDMTKPTK